MLTQMRSLSRNWLGRLILGVVLAFIIVSFVVWGGNRNGGPRGSFIAEVGDTRISVDQFRNAYQNQMARIQQQQKRAISPDEARRAGLDRQVLSRLLSMTILDQEAKKLGLAVGDDEVRQRIFANPVFKEKDGQFSMARFKALLANDRGDERSYIADERTEVMRADVTDAVVGGLVVPKALATAFHAYRSGVRDLEFLVLPAGAAGTILPPSEAELKTYYDERKGAFTAPEYRKLVVLSVVPANLYKPDAVTDAEIAKRYDEMKAERFVILEKRTMEQLLFSDEKAADAAAAKMKPGESFATLAGEAGGKAFQLGTLPKSGLGDPTLGDAAFALPVDGTTPPIKTRFGWAIVRVSKIVPGRTQPLAEVSAQLRSEIAAVQARATATETIKTITEARNAGKTVTEAATAAGLTPRTIEAVTAEGRDKAGRPVEGLPDGPELLKDAFRTGVGDDNTEALQTQNGGEVWYEVAAIEPTHDLPLADVKGKVEALWRGDEIARRLAAEADRLVKVIDGGKPLEAVAAENGKLQVVKAQNIARSGASVLPPAVLAEIFSVTVGKAGSATEPNHGRMVFKVEAARVPPLPTDDPDAAKLKVGFTDDVIAQYLAKVQSEIGVKLNQPALASALGDSGS